MRQPILFFAFAVYCSLAAALPAHAQQPPLAGGIRVCSQNLDRYGERPDGRPTPQTPSPTDFLASRIREAHCDIVAVQEVYGTSKDQALRNLQRLAGALAQVTARQYVSVVGEAGNDVIRNGFLFAQDAGRILQVNNLWGVNLPKLSLLGPSHTYTRAPLLLTVSINPAGGRPARKIAVLNIHLKSKVGGWKDPSGTEFENLRMETAELVRTWLSDQMRTIGPSAIVFIAGDRNANEESATSEILRGTRTLADFREGGSCSVDASLRPVCKSPGRPPLFVGLFRERGYRNPNLKTEGSLRYKGEQTLIDEIYISGKDLGTVTRPDGNYAVGFAGRFGDGSDHKLLWAETR